MVTVEKPTENVLTWHDFLQKSSDNRDGHADLLAQYWAKADSNDTLCIQFTSGTTGPRKAAMLSHRYVPTYLDPYRSAHLPVSSLGMEI
jgi:mevalonyl-CoA ligase